MAEPDVGGVQRVEQLAVDQSLVAQGQLVGTALELLD